MKLTTSLSKLRECGFDASARCKLAETLGSECDENSPINMLTILDTNGVDEMLWALGSIDTPESRNLACRLSVKFAEEALPVYERLKPNDSRPRDALEATTAYLEGNCSIEALTICRIKAKIAVAETRDALALAAYAAAVAAVAADVTDVALASIRALDASADAIERNKGRQANIIRMALAI